MKQSEMLLPTLKENPADAEIKSHQLLVRAGFIRKVASGIYSFLPIGNRVLKKVEAIVREEMEGAGAHEMNMTALQPSEFWKETGRWNTFGPELMRIDDRHQREFALGATHEEEVTALIRDEVKSYKQLPLSLYQIQTKFRDEQRPRFGLLRGREFLMKDAYTFHQSYESLDASYDKMFNAYSNIFSRLGLDFRAVIADSGAMGGKDTHEFMVLSEVGEDTIAYSDSSQYAANVEMAPVVTQYEKTSDEPKEREKVATPDCKTMTDVANYLGHTLAAGLKSIMFKVDEKLVMVITRGDHEINDVKLKNLYDASLIDLANEEETREVMGAGFGSLGPIGLPDHVEIVADYAVEALVNASCGANEDGFHYKNVTPGKDFEIKQYADLRFIEEGDPSPDGQGTIQFAKGIEVGHVFKLGEFYAEKMNATYLDENGKANTLIMGCYGIGISRTMASIVEQYHDENGITWPKQIAPYQVHLLALNIKKEDQKELADRIYETLKQAGIEVLYDDRKERAGVKFADSDLIGIPLRITVGKHAGEGYVECKERASGEQSDVHEGDLLDQITSFINQ
ncbi:proline--tRNA ligase [Pontibacillus yanchengensis]|uniref:Proline--tRNA ligase n=2 Tax=Pontibacillus yanchengensis TaxID=462910 RepID=A0ACC7VAR9_9BACI|nr:proline--tRNA ligase [Pontibacillus yanchengensis]MYL33179.1 proline--tRNA ligase [Pontibacillus yanchengensis]MYL51971.1 proline--tRNA ligase [Pontibacillus yanchengensis]